MLVSIAAVALAACGSSGSGGDDASDGPLRIGAIPDQDPEQLARLHGSLAGYLSEELQTEVEYVPVTDYAAAVSLFAAGDLDLVWFGGLTGVQARLQTPDSVVVA
jgi:phosphonate transport system substrate-binding protein